MKKRIALILLVIFCLALTACTNKENQAPKEPAASETEKPAENQAAENPKQEPVADEKATEEQQTNPEETKAVNADTNEKATEATSAGEKAPANVTPPPTVPDNGGKIQADAQFGSPGIDD